MNRLSRLSFLVLCAAVLTLPLPAQTFYGSVVGSVTDATAAAVPQAGVTLTNLGTGERRAMQTDGVGNYQFVNLVPGRRSGEGGLSPLLPRADHGGGAKHRPHRRGHAGR